MTMEILKTILLFAGGLGMFLYGMELMAEGLQQAAGDKTRKLLEALTTNPVMGLLAGALVTAIIQSSSATTVLVVGFVNAGLMSLVQAASVIMGANIGTTMTSWIVSMGEWAEFLKPEMIAPFLLLAGTFMHMLAKSSRVKDGAKILIGFGILFTGLSSMSGSIKPYASSPVFQNVFHVLGSNPLLAILAGAAVTAVIQSSSASMGILQTMAMAGAVNWGSAVFIALGQNIGTCVTALLSALSGDTNAKRAAMIHLEFNVIGAAVVGLAAAVFFMIYPSVALSGISSSGLAIFHTGFNVAATIMLFPFRKKLVELSKVLIVRHHPKKSKEELVLLDTRFQSMPKAAVSAALRDLNVLKERCIQLISDSRAVLIENDRMETLHEKSAAVQKECLHVRDYCSGIDLSAISVQEQRELQRILLSARDLHQIAETCSRIGRMNQEVIPVKSLSEPLTEQINTLSSLSEEALRQVSLHIMDDPASPSSALQEETAQAGVQHCVDEIRKRIASMRLSHLEAMPSDQKLSQNSWLVFEAADCYEQIAFRALRLSDEDVWQKHRLEMDQAMGDEADPSAKSSASKDSPASLLPMPVSGFSKPQGYISL